MEFKCPPGAGIVAWLVEHRPAVHQSGSSATYVRRGAHLLPSTPRGEPEVQGHPRFPDSGGFLVQWAKVLTVFSMNKLT